MKGSRSRSIIRSPRPALGGLPADARAEADRIR
jgi:hypothetical protein